MGEIVRDGLKAPNEWPLLIVDRRRGTEYLGRARQIRISLGRRRQCGHASIPVDETGAVCTVYLLK
ncbi:hypothetical protein GCM10027444_10340 [Actinopolyspora lacussalsi]